MDARGFAVRAANQGRSGPVDRRNRSHARSIVDISDEEFEHEVEAAIDSLPDRFKRALDNVGIAVADEPNERERATMQRQCDELLGLYEGVPITRRFTGYSGVMPDIITMYKGPHERVCATRDDLRRQIRKTVLHELGHYFGFDDDYLHAHGY